MDRVFLSNSGAEAVENAIKICYAAGGHRAFTFEGAFHGRTLGALSLNRSKAVHRSGFPEVPGVVSLTYPATDEAYERRWLTDGPGGNVVADALHPDRGVVDPDEVAYLILEPIQGEGGYRVAHPEFARDLEALRERYGLRIVADEIQSGLGRTGEMWAVDHLDLTPDVIASGKGLRVGATISRTDLFPAERGRLSSTWGAGDLIAAMAGALTIDVIHEANLLENVRERGEQLRTRLEDAVVDGDAPGAVDVRGRGLMLAVEFDTKARRDAVLEAAFRRGLLTLGCGYKTLRLLPPLDVTEREIDLGVELLLETIETVAENGADGAAG
jgi:4-aminobutyrate aminotransferase